MSEDRYEVEAANKELLKRFLSLWNSDGDNEDGFLEAEINTIFNESFDYREDSAMTPTRISGMSGPYSGRLLQREISLNQEVFSDLKLDTNDFQVLAEGNRAVAWWDAQGTQQHPVRLRTDGPSGPYVDVSPLENVISARGVTLATFEDGRITSLEMIWSPMSLLQQLAWREGHPR